MIKLNCILVFAFISSVGAFECYSQLSHGHGSFVVENRGKEQSAFSQLASKRDDDGKSCCLNLSIFERRKDTDVDNCDNSRVKKFSLLKASSAIHVKGGVVESSPVGCLRA